jgi:hypothetical protein
MEDRTTKSEESIETLDGVLPDGRSVDVIQNGATKRLKLIFFDGKQYLTEERIFVKGRMFVPPALDPALRSAVTLPAQASDYGCTNDLFRAIREVFTEYGMSPIATAVTYFVFVTWFAEPSWPAPCLVVMGPGAEASLLLQLLACLVRRGLRMTEIDSHGFRGLLQLVHPTVLFDARYFTPRGLRKLSACCGSRSFAPWKGSIADYSFSKVVYVGAALAEDVHFDFSLDVHLSPSLRGGCLLDGKKCDQISATLQPQLVAYRLRNLAKIRASDFDVPEADLEARTIGRSVGRCIVDAPEIQAGVPSLLEGRDEDLRTARWTDPTCVIIEALLDKCHVPQPTVVYVGEITEAATAIFRARGASTQLEDRGVGDCLRKLGFTPKRNAKGYRIFVTNKVIQVVHGLARDYRVAAVEHGVAHCAMCHQTFGVQDPDHAADVHGRGPSK